MTDEAPCGVDDVIITGELDRRPTRIPDYNLENRVLVALAETLAAKPDEALQALTDHLVSTGISESAGISLDECDGEERIFRWVAVSGRWSPFKGGTMPFSASPCGVVVGRDEVLLFQSPERAFPAANVDPLIREVLLVPFHVGDKPVGTVWAIMHGSESRFDAEDARMLQAFSRFASAAYSMTRDQAKLRESLGRQRDLLAELQHRVRNLLGMIRSVARQSVEGNESVEDYAAHLIGRLDALGRTQVLLTRNAEARVDLEGLVREELLVQRSDERKFVVQGPEVFLPAKAAEVLTLALHELATNSVKYGVLGGSEGRLSIEWSLETRDEVEWLDMQWAEKTSHDIPPRAKSGFGTDLIERRVPYELRGKASLRFMPKGLRAEIAFPLVDTGSILESGPRRSNGK